MKIISQSPADCNDSLRRYVRHFPVGAPAPDRQEPTVKEFHEMVENPGASVILLTESAGTRLTPAWIKEVHRAGMGIVCGPVESKRAVAHLASLGIEAIVSRDPQLFTSY